MELESVYLLHFGMDCPNVNLFENKLSANLSEIDASFLKKGHAHYIQFTQHSEMA